jgi:hypothetical protein
MMETPLLEQHPSQTLPEPFLFVPISGSEASKGRGAAKQAVRAHVTRVQHAKSSTLTYTRNLETWTVNPQRHRTQPGLSEGQSRIPRKKAVSGKVAAKRANSKQVAATIAKPDDDDAEEVVQTQTPETTTVVLNVPRLPAAKRLGASRQDPFWSYPVDYEPYLPAIFAHYIENVAVEIPDLDSPNHRGLLRRRWFPLAMEEPSTMYAVLLMAASHYCAVNPHSANLIDLLYLKSRALTEINAALRDPQRATSDAVIGAVMKMAAYEAVFGDSAVFSAHMRGLSLMLNMRGGLGTLGLDGLLERMVVWIDLNAHFVCGLSKLFGNEAFPTVVEFEAPDPYHFAGIQ